MTPDQFCDLPQEVRESFTSGMKEIAALKEELKEAKKKLKALSGDGKTKVSVCYYSYPEMKEIYLPEDSRIKFCLGKESSQVIEVCLDSSFVSVRGGDQLAIHPVVSNVVQVKLRNY